MMYHSQFQCGCGQGIGAPTIRDSLMIRDSLTRTVGLTSHVERVSRGK